MIKHRQCRLLIVDGYSSLINEQTVAIAAEFGCNMVVSSPGTPQENRKAEQKVRQVLELARAMMIGAPHLALNMSTK